MTLKSLKSSVLGCLFIFTTGAAGQSPLIDVQFSGGGPTSSGPAATGSAADDWNYIAATGPTSAIINVTGVTTSLTVTLGGTGGFFSYSSSVNPVNANLEDGYYYNNPAATFSISGLTPNAPYNLWVLSGTDPGAAYPTPAGSARPSTIVANGVSLSNAGVTENGYVNGGNFVEFVNLAADGTGTITVTATSTTNSEVDLNGFQLQPVPPPPSISFIGSDPGDNSWRTPSVPKPLDPDGNNIYGTAGYDVFDSSAGTLLHAPAGVTITRLAPNIFPGNGSYTLIDNPSGGAAIRSGVAYFNPVSTGQVLDYASVTFTTAANYVIGIYTDNADFPGISPSALRIYKTNGSGDSGLISNTPSQGGDWYLFSVSANAGDVLNIQGIGVSNPSGSSGIGIITLDSGLGSTPPSITTTSLPGGTVGTAYSQTLAATGGISPYQNWTAVSGSLPPGLTLNAGTGVINGTPTSATGSPFSFSVTVQDNANNTSTAQSLSISILALAQTITFAPLSNVSLGVSPFAIGATASSGLTASFASNTLSVCTVNAATVTILTAGTCSITASQAGNAAYAAATPMTQTFTVQQTQTITFAPLSNLTLGVAPFTVSATASSGLTAIFASSTLSVCTVNAATVTILTAGTCSITASQAGNAAYAAATPVTQTFTVQQTQTITFGPLSNVSPGVSPFGIGATASSGLTVSFASNTPSVCTVNAATVTILTAGTCSITASQAGNAAYAAATPVTQTFTVQQTQTITFAPLSNVSPGVSPFGIGATASSGLTVSFASNTPSVCSVNAATVTILTAGTCSITASQAGNAAYAAATPVTQTFTVQQTQTIMFGPLSNVSPGVSPFGIGATASSGLTVSFASNTPSVCSVNAATVTILAAGTCSITASQAGNANYAAATPVTQTFTVQQTQTITFNSLRNVTIGASPFGIGATASSGLTVSFASNTLSVCTVNAATVTILTAGTCSITASQAGNATYAAATPVTQTFTVQQTQTITFSSPSNVTLGAAPFTISATASSGLTVTFASNTFSVCTVNAATVTILTAGTCSITASQAGNATYAAATPVMQTFTVQQTQTITLNSLHNVTLGASPFGISATASSGLTVSFASNTLSVCTVNAATVTILTAGTCSITAGQAGNATYAAATPVTQTFTVLNTQTITFSSPSNVTLGAAPFTISATASSGLTVSFASNTLSVCTVNAATVTILTAGTCSITASQAGNATYAAATPVMQTFTVQQTQTITLNSLHNVTLGASPFGISATASSGLTVSFASNTFSVCTVNAATVTILTAGNCSITATQTGNATYAAATPVTQTFTVLNTQTITFSSPSNVTLGAAPFTISATASSGLTVTFASNTFSVCTVNAATVTILTAGNCSITATQTGNATYAAATPVTQTFTVAQTQTITFAPLSNVTFGVTPFSISATSTSGLTVSFISNTPSVCSVSAATVTIGTVGTCSVMASQAGNGTYAPALPVTQSFNVNPGSQTISFGTLGTVVFGAPPFPISAMASSGLTVKFTSSTTSVCMVVGSTVTVNGAGICSIVASQAGNASYNAAAPVTQSFVVYAPLAITTSALPDSHVGQSYSVTLSATGGSTSYVWSTSSTLPAGVGLSGLGVISGTPTAPFAGTISVTVTDGTANLTATANLSLSITALPVVISGSANLGDVAAGASIAASYSASGGVPPYTFALSGAPGLAVDANGNIRGSATTAGSFTPSLTVTDSVKATSSLALSLEVLGVTGSFPTGSTTASYSGSAVGVGGVPPYTYAASGIPPGLTFSAGVLSGQVTIPGSYSVGVQVTDSKGIGASAGFSFQITGPTPQNLTIASGSLPNGFVGQAYSQTLAAAGGAPSYSWSQSGGQIPAGLSLGSNGTVVGTPTAPGSYTIGVQVTDSAGTRVVGTITVNIQPAPLQLTNGATFPAGQVGVDYPAQILVAQGGVPPYTFGVAGSLPSGLSLTNGQIAGSPATTGNYAFTLTVTDSAPMPATATLAATATINPNSPDLVLSSASTAFSFASGVSAAPAPAAIPIASTTPSQILSFTASSSAPWLTVGGSSSTPGAISVGLNSTALALTAAESPFAGSVLVTCTSSSCAGKSQNIAVSLNIVQTPPQLILSPAQLSFVEATSNPAPSTQNLAIVNGGAGMLDIQSVSTAAPWITIGAFPSSVLPGPGASVAITVNPAGLNPGYYKGSVTVNTSAGAASVPVTLLLAPSALLTLAPSGAQFSVPTGGVLGESSGSFLVSIASGSVNYTASVLPGANWLVASGSGTAMPSSPGMVTYNIGNSAVAALPVGPQYATIRVTGAGVVDSPLDFQVILNVTPKTTSVIPNPQPAGLLFIASGGTVNPQNISLFASSATPIPFQATANTASGGGWLSATPSTGTTSASSAAQISVSVSTAGLQPGVYTGTVDFAFASSVRSVNVTLIVAAPHSANSGTTQLTSSTRDSGLQPRATPACAGAQLVPVDTGLVSNFSAPAAWPTPLALTLFDTCGNAVGNGQLVVTFSNGDPPLALAAADPPNGLYSGTWTPRATSQQVTILAKATAQGYPAATIQIAGQVAPNPAPALAPNGTSDIFNPQVGAGLGPGNIVQIYGTGLSGVASTPAMLPLPTQVNGTSVIIGGETAPLFYVSPGQINAQIPFDLTPGNQYEVLVSANGALTTPQPIQLTTAVPAILQFNSGDAVAQFSDGTLVSDTSPSAPGDFLTIYLSGLGATDIQVPAGSPSPSGPLANVLDTPVLTLNGVTVPVLFAGLTPGLVGLYQIDFQVPQPLTDGNYTLLITQSGTASNQTILPVKN